MRRDDDVVVTWDCSPEEVDALDQMQRITGCTTRANLLRTMAWHYAEHLDMRIDLLAGVFDERHGQGRKRTKAAS